MNVTWFYTGQNAWKNSCKPEWKQKNLQKIQPLTPLYTVFHEKGSPFHIPSISDKCCPFHISCLELCIPFDCCKSMHCFFYIEISKSICLKCNTARFLDQEISCCMWFKLLLLYPFIFGVRSNWVSCCGVPSQIFKLLLVYCYVLITSVCISSLFFFPLYSSGQS